MVWYAEQDNLMKPAEGISGISLLCVPTSVGFLLETTMKKIPLTQGKFALVDDADFEWLSQWKWCAVKGRSTYYAMRTAPKSTGNIKMHREILKVPKGLQGDHRNGNGLDNRRQNLRICTHAENIWNQKKERNSKGKLKGASFTTTKLLKNPWRSQICYNKKKIHLGYFATPEEAARAYDAAAKRYFGEFARLNFPAILARAAKEGVG